jgi:hypothetical protein
MYTLQHLPRYIQNISPTSSIRNKTSIYMPKE